MLPLQVDSPDCPDECREQLDLLYPDEDLPLDLIELLDDKENNWEQRKREGLDKQLMGTDYSPTQLKPPVWLDAKHLYVKVHQDPIRYYHLYQYLVNRYCSRLPALLCVICSLLPFPAPGLPQWVS